MNEKATSETVTECKFCYRQADEMIEPRALPCDHIFCSPCIEGHYNPHNDETVCIICKVAHKGIAASKLPQANLSAQAAEEKPLCDLCEGPDEAEAIRYCIDCEHKLCDEDLAFHEKLQRKSMKRPHRLVSMEEYLTAPGRYSKLYCKDHPRDELTVACAQCYKTFCVYDGSDVYQICPKAKAGLPHEIRPLHELASELRGNLSHQVDKLKEKVNKVNQNIKSASRGLDEAETQLTTLHMEIDQHAQKLVEEVLHQAEKSKDVFEENHKQTESYLLTYMVETDLTMSELDDLFTIGRQTVLRSHDVEIFERYADLLGELKNKMGDQSEEITHSVKAVYLNKGKPVIHTDIYPSLKPGLDDWMSHINECKELKSKMDFSYKELLEHMMISTGAFKRTTEWLNNVFQKELEEMKRKEDDMEKDYQSLTDEALDKLKGSSVDDDLSIDSFAYRWHNDILKSECDRQITHLRLNQKQSQLDAYQQTSRKEIQKLEDKMLAAALRAETEKGAWAREKQMMKNENEAEIKRLLETAKAENAAWAGEKQMMKNENEADIKRLVNMIPNYTFQMWTEDCAERRRNELFIKLFMDEIRTDLIFF